MAETLQNGSVVSALIGLAGACNNNPKTPQTDRLLLEALAGEQAAEAVRAEKFAVAPDCAVCANPCGNTSDYDMERLYAADAEIRETKVRILETMRETAAILLHRQQTEIDLFYKALLYVGSDLDAATLHTLLEEMQAFQRKVEKNGTI